jgi:hypothetical protein
LTDPAQPRDRRDPIQEIKDAVDALTNPRQHTEPRHEWTEQRNKRPLEPWRTIVPGLIQQLRDLAEPGVDGDTGGRGGAESCPVAIDAVSLLAAIGHGTAKRITDSAKRGYRVERQPTTEDDLRALIGLADYLPSGRNRTDPYQCEGCATVAHWNPCHTCQPTTQRELAAELRAWQHQAEVIAQWRTPAQPLPAPCPECDARGALLARADGAAAAGWCTACSTRWESEAEVAILARHVADYVRRSGEASREARARAVGERRRREGADPAGWAGRMAS